MVIDSMFVYHFVNPDLRVVVIFRKERTAENGGIDFEIVDINTTVHWYKSTSRHLFLAPLEGQNMI